MHQSSEFIDFLHEQGVETHAVEQGNRIYPKKPSGKLHNLRIGVAIGFIGLLMYGPFIRSHGQPFFLFNVFERKFILFGSIFWPQDFGLLLFATLIFFVFIILFTAVFGRVWCGWACPQTLFMEMVFRKIEYCLEGDAIQQKKLTEGSYNLEKLWKRGIKHLLFIAVSIVISHTVMAYLIGTDEVRKAIFHSPAENWSGFTGLVIFTAIFYLVFTKLREKACTVICPYGRLQSVLMTKDTMRVLYDVVRGEPRGKIKKNEPNAHAGDCVDCHLCVKVCPTAIDIREGLQMECVSCTACIDVCNDVMVKTGRTEGLIRFDVPDYGIEKKKDSFPIRIVAYSVILVGLCALLVTLLAFRTDVETTVLRVPGMLYQTQPNGNISNLYNFQIVNKTFMDIYPELKITGNTGTIKLIGESLIVPKQAKTEGVFFIEIAPSDLKSVKTKLSIEVLNQGKKIDEISTNFISPATD